MDSDSWDCLKIRQCNMIVKLLGVSGVKKAEHLSSLTNLVLGKYAQPFRLHESDAHQYDNIVGSLLYLATKSGPNIDIGAKITILHVPSPSGNNRSGAGRVFSYLRGTNECKLKLSPEKRNQPYSYVNANLGGEPNTGPRCKYEFLKRFGGVPIFVINRLLQPVPPSSTESEYLALYDTGRGTKQLQGCMGAVMVL